MRIAIGSDHAGFHYKTEIIAMLKLQGHDVLDKGTYTPETCDYPDFIRPAAEAVASGGAERGIVLGGSGNGEAIVANRVRGVRCSLAWNLESARLGRRHNDANVLSLGERMMDLQTAFDIVNLWLNETFDGGRHALRIAKIDP